MASAHAPDPRTSLQPRLVLAPTAAAAKCPYARAERYLPWHANKLVTGDSVDANWFEDGNRFWYRNKGAQGAEWWVVDPVQNTKGRALGQRPAGRGDEPRARHQLRSRQAADPRVQVRRRREGRGADRVHRHEEAASPATSAATPARVGDTLPSEVPFVRSPDKQWEAFVSKNNLWVRRAAAAIRCSSRPMARSTGPTASRRRAPATSRARSRGGRSCAGRPIRRRSW